MEKKRTRGERIWWVIFEVIFFIESIPAHVRFYLWCMTIPFQWVWFQFYYRYKSAKAHRAIQQTLQEMREHFYDTRF